jgi:hypothetical protein
MEMMSSDEFFLGTDLVDPEDMQRLYDMERLAGEVAEKAEAMIADIKWGISVNNFDPKAVERLTENLSQLELATSVLHRIRRECIRRRLVDNDALD